MDTRRGIIIIIKRSQSPNFYPYMQSESVFVSKDGGFQFEELSLQSVRGILSLISINVQCI